MSNTSREMSYTTGSVLQSLSLSFRPLIQSRPSTLRTDFRETTNIMQ